MLGCRKREREREREWGGQCLARPGGVAFNKADATAITAISFSPEDQNGNLTRPVAIGDIVEFDIDGDIIRVLPNATSHANDHGNDRAPTDLPSQCLQDLVVRQRVHIARAYADERGNVCEGRAELSFGLVLHSPARVTGLSGTPCSRRRHERVRDEGGCGWPGS